MNCQGLLAAQCVRGEARLRELDEQVKQGEYVAAIEYATAYTTIGDKEKAFTWLEKATQEHNHFAVEFKINPLYDSLRNDPRFQKLVESVKVIH